MRHKNWLSWHNEDAIKYQNRKFIQIGILVRLLIIIMNMINMRASAGALPAREDIGSITPIIVCTLDRLRYSLIKWIKTQLSQRKSDHIVWKCFTI